MKDKAYPPRRPVIQTYDDAGHGTISKVLDRKPISKTKPKMRDGRGFIKNLVDMMSAVVDVVDDPVDMMDSHGPTIVYKNIFIYWALKMYLKYWTLII